MLGFIVDNFTNANTPEIITNQASYLWIFLSVRICSQMTNYKPRQFLRDKELSLSSSRNNSDQFSK